MRDQGCQFGLYFYLDSPNLYQKLRTVIFSLFDSTHFGFTYGKNSNFGIFGINSDCLNKNGDQAASDGDLVQKNGDPVQDRVFYLKNNQ